MNSVWVALFLYVIATAIAVPLIGNAIIAAERSGDLPRLRKAVAELKRTVRIEARLTVEIVRRFQWNVRYTFFMWRACRYNCALDFAWVCAVESMDSFNDGLTPAEAVDSEMSYWEE